MGHECFSSVEIVRELECRGCDLDEVSAILTSASEEAETKVSLCSVKIKCSGMNLNGGEEMCDLDFDIRTYTEDGKLIGRAQTNPENNSFKH